MDGRLLPMASMRDGGGVGLSGGGTSESRGVAGLDAMAGGGLMVGEASRWGLWPATGVRAGPGFMTAMPLSGRMGDPTASLVPPAPLKKVWESRYMISDSSLMTLVCGFV